VHLALAVRDQLDLRVLKEVLALPVRWELQAADLPAPLVLPEFKAQLAAQVQSEPQVLVPLEPLVQWVPQALVVVPLVPLEFKALQAAQAHKAQQVLVPPALPVQQAQLGFKVAPALRVPKVQPDLVLPGQRVQSELQVLVPLVQ
jgi:hypothetical protein